MYLCIYLYFCRLSIYLCIYLSIYVSIYLSVYLSDLSSPLDQLLIRTNADSIDLRRKKFREYSASPGPTLIHSYFLPFLYALEVIKALKVVMPIQRAQMRLRIVISPSDSNKVKEKLADVIATTEEEGTEDGEYSLVCFSPILTSEFVAFYLEIVTNSATLKP